MFQKIRTFWTNFWSAIKFAYNETFKNVPKEETQDYRDLTKINFLSIFVTKLKNLSCVESTYDVISDSVQAEPLKSLCKDLEAKRAEITENMLGDGDYWVFPSHTNRGELFHRYVTQDCVRILNMDGDNITDLIGVIDEYIDQEKQVYLLNRRHTLDGDTLTVHTYVTNLQNEMTSLEKWQDVNDVVYQFTGAKHIGVGRFKSPVSSRGLSPVYGVPLNFGCQEIEEKIFKDLSRTEKEFDNGESKIFADPLIMRKGKDKVGQEEWQIPENVFPIDTRGGTSGASIDIFSPAIRYVEYKEKFYDDCREYENLVGLDKGFLTPFDNGSYTNTAEVRRENANTIAFIDNIHTAIKNGVEMTLKADAVFLNIADDLYSLKFDFYDAFADEEQQYTRIANAVDRGVLEKEDELRWLYPNMTDEEIAEKLARIQANSQANTDMALERILQGQ